MLKRTCFISLSLFFALTCSALAQQGAIHGKVRNQSGATLNGVIVELWQSGSNLSQTVTNTEGDFYFSSLVPAVYEIVITHQGYQRVSERAVFRLPGNMNQREVVEVEIRLMPLERENPGTPPGTSFAQEVPPAAREAFEKGMASLKEGRSAVGIAALEEAVRIFPDYFNAHFALGTEYSRLNRLDEAVRSLERARAINDRDGRVWQMFGIMMAQREKFTIAEYAFRQAGERDPASAQVRFSRGLTLIELGLRAAGEERQKKFAEAERELNRALELSSRKLSAAWLHLARIHELRGERQQAAKALETYLKSQPDDKNAPAIREAILKLKGPKTGQ
jgi:Tfp pilus assembly protein PilF